MGTASKYETNNIFICDHFEDFWAVLNICGSINLQNPPDKRIEGSEDANQFEQKLSKYLERSLNV